MRPFNPEALTERIVRLLLNGGPMTSKQIAAALGLKNVGRISSTLNWLDVMKRVERHSQTRNGRGNDMVIWRAARTATHKFEQEARVA